MKMIKSGELLVAMVFDGVFEDGTRPLTDEQLALQVIALKHPKGKKLVSHSHSPKERTTKTLVEALIVFSGRVAITAYTREGSFVEKIELGKGQGILIVDGGIGIEILEDAEMMEFKNGPFIEDKIVFDK
ncbi:MAG: hypothetical protein WCV80_01740 [Candidatus Paceibacterota bacterium]|jgi:hypothetical protein